MQTMPSSVAYLFSTLKVICWLSISCVGCLAVLLTSHILPALQSGWTTLSAALRFRIWHERALWWPSTGIGWTNWSTGQFADAPSFHDGSLKRLELSPCNFAQWISAFSAFETKENDSTNGWFLPSSGILYQVLTQSAACVGLLLLMWVERSGLTAATWYAPLWLLKLFCPCIHRKSAQVLVLLAGFAKAKQPKSHP